MEVLSQISSFCSVITVIFTTLILFIKPLREKILGLNLIKEGLKCLLRSEILHIYYKNREQKTIRQYEYENFTFCYKAYKSLKGNSFTDHINNEIKEWEVIS